jgi:hypothetical protein
MSFRSSRLAAGFAGVAAAGLLLAALPGTAVAGPPWISIELPANPLNSSTRGAYLLVRTYHHARVVSVPLTGRAIGVVDGKRQTVELTFARTSMPGVYAVRRTWPAEGAWALAVHLGEGSDGGATALVGIADGEVRSVRVPTRNQNGHTIPRSASQEEIEATLTMVSSLAAGPGAPSSGLAPIHALILVPLGLGLGAALTRR